MLILYKRQWPHYEFTWLLCVANSWFCRLIINLKLNKVSHKRMASIYLLYNTYTGRINPSSEFSCVEHSSAILNTRTGTNFAYYLCIFLLLWLVIYRPRLWCVVRVRETLREAGSLAVTSSKSCAPTSQFINSRRTLSIFAILHINKRPTVD